MRFVGEPVAVVVAHEPLPGRGRRRARRRSTTSRCPRSSIRERALEPDAPVLHEDVGSNLAGHRRLVYGDPDRAFREADVVVRERFAFPKYGSTPIETYGVIARWDPLDGVLHDLVELHGAVHHAPADRAGAGAAREQAALHRADRHRRLASGSSRSIYPYMALIGLAAMKTGVPVKWIEDRREHLLASSSGTDRVA